tara:strand:+ start:7900 stop:8640 length:741 start_codon:yes stop_codon:yes gene_type:complete
MKSELKNKAYKLTRNAAPLSFMIPARNSARTPLLYFDEEKGYNRPLRYARNQKSPFEDEQDGNAIVEPIIFEDGMLTVPKTNPVLQEFLNYHPMNGKKFVEIDQAKDAQEEYESMTTEVDALIEARSMSIDQMEVIARVIFNKDVSLISTSELKRDVLVFARINPEMFMRAVNDPSLKLQSNVQRFFDNSLLSFRNHKRDVHFNLPNNKKRMAIIPFEADPMEYLSEWFKSDEGVEVLQFLEKQLD